MCESRNVYMGHKMCMRGAFLSRLECACICSVCHNCFHKYESRTVFESRTVCVRCLPLAPRVPAFAPVPTCSIYMDIFHKYESRNVYTSHELCMRGAFAFAPVPTCTIYMFHTYESRNVHTSHELYARSFPPAPRVPTVYHICEL